MNESSSVVSFKDLEQAIFDMACELARNITREIMETFDKELQEQRDKSRFQNKQKRKTTIKCLFGTVEYKRTQYYDRTEKKYLYLLDEHMDIEKVGLISANLSKMIAKSCTYISYRKSAEMISELTGQDISSHGAWDVVKKLANKVKEHEEDITKEISKSKKIDNPSKILFVEQDGVYIKIQENHKKAKSQEIKLATMYEGWKGKRLNNKKVFIGLENSEMFGKKVEATIQHHFNIDFRTQRILNGDGAGWVSNTYNMDRIYQLDRFHIYNKIKNCISNKNVCNLICNDFRKKEYNKIFEDITTYINSIENAKEIERAKELYEYLNNNRKALPSWQEQIGKIPIPPEGIKYKNMGVQENQNCSLVCMRMKGRKMRWSVDGANNLVKIIYTLANKELDQIIEDMDGSIPEPDELINKITKIPKKVGSGNRYAELVNAHMPSLNSIRSGLNKTLRKLAYD